MKFAFAVGVFFLSVTAFAKDRFPFQKFYGSYEIVSCTDSGKGSSGFCPYKTFVLKATTMTYNGQLEVGSDLTFSKLEGNPQAFLAVTMVNRENDPIERYRNTKYSESDTSDVLSRTLPKDQQGVVDQRRTELSSNKDGTVTLTDTKTETKDDVQVGGHDVKVVLKKK